MILLIDAIDIGRWLFLSFALQYFYRTLKGGKFSALVFGIMVMDKDNASWVTLQKCYTNKIGVARVQITGTVSWDDIYQDPALKEIYIFKRAENRQHQITGGGTYDAYIDLEVGDGTVTTHVTIKNAIIRLWGRLKVGQFAGDVEVSTLTLGEKGTNSRSSGVTLMITGWRSIQNIVQNNSVLQAYDSQLIQTSGIVAAGSLVTTSGSDDAAWGEDRNFVLAGTLECERFAFRYGEKIRMLNDPTGSQWNNVNVVTTNIDEIEAFYDGSGSFPHIQSQWEFEAADIPMRGAFNSQVTDNGIDVVWDQCVVIDAQVAEAAVEHSVNTWFNDITVIGGTGDNEDFTVKLTTSYGVVATPEINFTFPVSFLIVDNSDGSVISGARIRIYNNNVATDLATIATFGATVVQGTYDFTTDSNGEVPSKNVLKKFYNSGVQTDATQTFSAHVAAGVLTLTDRSPLLLSIQATGFKTYQAALVLKKETVMTIGLDPPSTNPDNCLPFFVIA